MNRRNLVIIAFLVFLCVFLTWVNPTQRLARKQEEAPVSRSDSYREPNALAEPTKEQPETQSTSPGDLSQNTIGPKFVTGGIDLTEVNEKLRQQDKKNKMQRFAEAIEVSLSHQNSGKWIENKDHLIWSLSLKSPGAASLNLGFAEYYMPEGGEMLLHAPGKASPFRPFTSTDNQAHGELWTPVLPGEEMVIRVRLPREKRDELKLRIGSINHGFRSVLSAAMRKNSSTTQKMIESEANSICYMDVACALGDTNINSEVGAVAEFFRDQIRSVGAYTIQGLEACSGTLINNTSNDNTPYFLTAFHCFADDSDETKISDNSHTAVFYFNFQNSVCRPPNTADSGRIGDGDLTQFVPGAQIRAAHFNTDMCLLQLSQAIPADFDVYFSGWNRSSSVPTMGVGISHPSVDEKRITMDFDSLVDRRNYWRVVDWEMGSTEGGSSGSGLFDGSGLLVGQLQGGRAACGNDLEDEYGKISVSWNGGGSTPSRLRDWLAPSSAQPVTLEGRNHTTGITIEDAEILEGDSGNQMMVFPVNLSDPTSNTVSVDYQTSDMSAEAGSDYSATSGTLQFSANQTTQSISVPVSGDTTTEGTELFRITLSNPVNANLRSDSAQGRILTDDSTIPTMADPGVLSGTVDTLFEYNIDVRLTKAEFQLVGEYPSGMNIDEASGIIRWVPSAVGSYSFRVESRNSLGSDRRDFTINVGAGSDMLAGSELRQLGVYPKEEGSISWFRQTAQTHDGIDALKSGTIGDDGDSSLVLDIHGPGTITFWMLVDTERNYDFAHFSINEHLKVKESGNTGWRQYSFDLPSGLNRLSWLYLKDYAAEDGADAVYLDEVSFTGYAGWAATHKMASLGSFNSDSEGDGVANGLEYAVGLSPDSNDAAQMPAASLGANQLLSLAFSKPPGVLGIKYAAELSNDLQQWGTDNIEVITNDSGYFSAREKTSAPDSNRRFIRLKVSPADQ